MPRLPQAGARRRVERGKLRSEEAIDREAMREIVEAVNEPEPEPPKPEPKKKGRK